MPKKSTNAEDLHLSLTGSQLLSPGSGEQATSSARSRTSSRRQPSAAGKKSTLNVVNGLSSRSNSGVFGKSRQQSQSTPRQLSGPPGGTRPSTNHRIDTASASAPKTHDRDDFLALFDAGAQPKIMKSDGSRSHMQKRPKDSVRHKRTRPPDVANEGSLEGSASQVSHGTVDSCHSHSVFQPISARTSSTVDREDGDDEDGQEPFVVEGSPEGGRHRSLGDELRLNLSHPFPTREEADFSLEQRAQSIADVDDWMPALSGGGGQDDAAKGCLYGELAGTTAQKSHRLTSIANNMTSQAMSPGTKMALTDMENSYQNIKPKTPVNQVRQPPFHPVQHMSATTVPAEEEDQGQRARAAAVCIQRWFRRHQTRRKVGEAAMRRLLDSKRTEKVEQLAESKDYVSSVGNRRAKARVDRLQQTRQEAIQELQRKRKEKHKEKELVADQETKFSRPVGKHSESRGHGKPTNVYKSHQLQARAAQSPPSCNSDAEQGSNPGADPPRPSTAASATRRIDDIFQNNSPRPSVKQKEEMQLPGRTAEPDDHPAEAWREEGGCEEEEEDDDHTISALQTGRDTEASAASLPINSHSGTKTTLDDLMETLKKLEEEEDKLPSQEHNKNKTPRNWLDDLDKGRPEEEHSEYGLLTTDRLRRLTPSKDNIQKSGFLTDEKLRSIISFLDEVETADHLEEISQELNKGSEVASEFLVPVPPPQQLPVLVSDDQVAEMEQATLVASEVTKQVLTQRLELEEKQRSVSMLQKALNQQRELTVRHAHKAEKEMKKRLDVQKEEYEEAIKRHLSFIDQLIDDKKALSEKCQNLVKEMKTIDKKYQDKLKLLQDGHDVELKKVKEVQAAAEKLRREKWIDEKTKRIKEMTVKGLEPEIQRLIAKHKAEVKKMKSIHEAELLESDERAGQRYVSMTEQLRDQLSKEKELACTRERELARQTYEKQLRQEEEAYQQQRSRLHQEVQEEKERLASAAARQRAELDKLQRQLEESHANASVAMKKEYEKSREEQERRHASELRHLKEQLEVEKAAWEENYKKRQETWLTAKERELKEKVRVERDKEIEHVISRLEEDSQMGREECERVAENRIKRIRDKYEAEITELEQSERITTQKYNETKARLAEYEGENERLKVTVKQKQHEIDDLKQILDKRNEERDRVADVIRQEFADRLVATDEECRRLKNDLSEQHARHRIELERAKTQIDVVTRSKEEEMEEVHKRVKQAIVKKEEVVNQLKVQYQAAVKRADHLEGLLEQQRKQLLKK